MSQQNRFPGPFEVKAPAGAEGWESLYPYYYLFSEDRRSYEEGAFWYQDAMHHPEPLFPFDTITCESWWVALGQNNTRIFQVPPALGIDQRVLNGYLYITPIPANPDEIPARVEQFMKRAGYYYENWDRLYAKWKDKANSTIAELEELSFPELPEIEDESVVTGARGISTGYDLITAYNRAIENMYRMWQLHFEFLNLGYAAYLTFYEFCKKAFPAIPDQAIARMVAGIDVVLYKPDGELRRLAQKAVDLGIDSAFNVKDSSEAIFGRLKGNGAGQQWLEDFEATKHPWFYFSTGTGFYHHHRSWIDNLDVPVTAISSYIDLLKKGESLDRPIEELTRKREELVTEYRALLSSDEDRQAFDNLVGLARTVFPYVEEHNFYVEHWHHTVFWNKIRELGAQLAARGFFAEADDIFYLHRFEVQEALYDLISAWASGGIPRGTEYWPREVARRKKILAALGTWSPVPALGTPPAVINEPFTVMLWGITTDQVTEWLTPKEEGDNRIKGFPASPGSAEGSARVVMTVEQLAEVQDGEILICPITTPSWAPVFAKVQAVVTDIGGIMSHAAIVCREYGMPAVTGTGFGTKNITTGQRVRVEGETGIVTVIG